MTAKPVADLGDIIAHLTEPQDPPVITGPWWPRTTDVAFKPCGCGVLTGESCDCQSLLAELEQANRRPILFDFRREAA